MTTNLSDKEDNPLDKNVLFSKISA